ncbi:MAG: hypothetical protein JJT87_00245 [Halomonas sp.]|uniref:hypothetical protein n=1 Tax=unclassified Halomonas TaxID=2609666 RepID=UPI0009904C6A|nr:MULTISPECIES: hypothetical protein [unclassified Halomonas]AQU82874.1 hypothetical protein B2G49_09825 [Halomonas sp. 'Soap Lake \
MALYLLVLGVCLLVIGCVFLALVTAGTPRYRTEANDLLSLFDKALNSQVSETEWNTIIGYPIRHDEYLDSIRRRAMHLMDIHGRRWQIAQGKPLLNQEGHAELTVLRDHLAAHTALRQAQQR